MYPADPACTACGSLDCEATLVGESCTLRCLACGHAHELVFISLAGGDPRYVEAYVAHGASPEALAALASRSGMPVSHLDVNRPLLRGQLRDLQRAIARVALDGVPVRVRWVPAPDIVDRDDGWSTQCGTCGRQGDYAFGDRAHGTGLSWFESFRCDGCGCASEADGPGPMPESLRQRWLARFGTWALQVREGSPVAVMKVARDVLGLGLNEAAKLKASFPGPLWPGTRAEAERAARALAAAGVKCELVRVQDGTARREAPPVPAAAPASPLVPNVELLGDLQEVHARKFFDVLANELAHVTSDDAFVDPRAGIGPRLMWAPRFRSALGGAEADAAERLIEATSEARQRATRGEPLEGEWWSTVLDAVDRWRRCRVPNPPRMSRAPMFVEREGVACPHCGASSGTFRQLAGALVCSSCGRSFAE